MRPSRALKQFEPAEGLVVRADRVASAVRTQSGLWTAPAQLFFSLPFSRSIVMTSRWTVLYTKDKQKKAKTWHDGYVTVSASGRASLFSEEGEALDSGSFGVSSFVPGATVEFERFLVELSCDGAPPSASSVVSKPVPAAAPSVAPVRVGGRSVAFQEHSGNVPIPPPQKPVVPFAPVTGSAAAANAPAKRSLAEVLSMLKGGNAAAPTAPAPAIPVALAPVVAPIVVPNAFARSVTYEPPAKRQSMTAQSPALSPAPSANPVASFARRQAESNPPTNARAAAAFLCGPIRFPTRDQVRDAPRTLTVAIPQRFSSVKDYSNVYSNAVRETVNLQICRSAEQLFGVLNKAGGTGSESAFRAARIEAYGNCSLATREWRGLKGKLNVSLVLTLPSGWMTRSRGEHSKDDLWAVSFLGNFEDAFIVHTVFHGIGQNGTVNMELMPHQSGPVVARGGSDSTLVNTAFKSQSNVCAYRLLSASTELQELTALAGFGEGDPLVNALVMPSQQLRLPVFGPFPPAAAMLKADEIVAVQRRIVQEFALNEEQQTVLQRVADWFSHKPQDNVTLVHGVFGAGKSTLLVAVILFLVEVMDRADEINDGAFSPPRANKRIKETKKSEDEYENDEEEDEVIVLDEDEEKEAKLKREEEVEADHEDEEEDQHATKEKPERRIRMRPPPLRVAVSSSTNTAVDRVLEGLLDAGCRDFLRVGSIKKMSRRVLPFTLYEEEKDAIHEMRKLLKDDELSSGERLDLEKELEELVSGRAGKRKERLGLCPIVGTTCSASLFKLFKDHHFSVLLLDECSQMVEPLSLLPIKSFFPRKLICVGDPMQLAPPLPSDAPGARDLSLAMFSRLSSTYQPILLATQYRCHPRIADLASRLFYGGRLRSGVTEEQRSAVLYGFEPITVIDSAGIGLESKDSNGSWSNAMHTRITVQMLLHKIGPHFPSPDAMANRVGVISMFRAQTRELRKAMAAHQLLASVRVSTVDSFQGAEQDVIVVVSSRVGDNAGGQFLIDVRRLNVTLTRARYHVIIVGDAKALRSSSNEWRGIVAESKVIGADQLLME